MTLSGAGHLSHKAFSVLLPSHLCLKSRTASKNGIDGPAEASGASDSPWNQPLWSWRMCQQREKVRVNWKLAPLAANQSPLSSLRFMNAACELVVLLERHSLHFICKTAPLALPRSVVPPIKSQLRECSRTLAGLLTTLPLMPSTGPGTAGTQ